MQSSPHTPIFTEAFFGISLRARIAAMAEVSPLLWSSKNLGYTIPEENQEHAEKDLHAGV
jgi:hypothetical protein